MHGQSLVLQQWRIGAREVDEVASAGKAREQSGTKLDVVRVRRVCTSREIRERNCLHASAFSAAVVFNTISALFAAPERTLAACAVPWSTLLTATALTLLSNLEQWSDWLQMKPRIDMCTFFYCQHCRMAFVRGKLHLASLNELC